MWNLRCAPLLAHLSPTAHANMWLFGCSTLHVSGTALISYNTAAARLQALRVVATSCAFGLVWVQHGAGRACDCFRLRPPGACREDVPQSSTVSLKAVDSVSSTRTGLVLHDLRGFSLRNLRSLL